MRLLLSGRFLCMLKTTHRLFRESSVDSIASAAIDEGPVASTSKLPPRKRAKKNIDAPPAKRGKGKGKASEFIPTIEWPDHFKRLEQVFKERLSSAVLQ